MPDCPRLVFFNPRLQAEEVAAAAEQVEQLAGRAHEWRSAGLFSAIHVIMGWCMRDAGCGSLALGTGDGAAAAALPGPSLFPASLSSMQWTMSST